MWVIVPTLELHACFKNLRRHIYNWSSKVTKGSSTQVSYKLWNGIGGQIALGEFIGTEIQGSSRNRAKHSRSNSRVKSSQNTFFLQYQSIWLNHVMILHWAVLCLALQSRLDRVNAMSNGVSQRNRHSVLNWSLHLPMHHAICEWTTDPSSNANLFT